ncbi:sugar diacid recognition domain-containing protein [Agrococcus sp. ARC_14]|uniref:CdaR family transcriptional regulator n=1 Tax=Agrococcus sp. ARC_14 TaxID=2919927 RepID=UPI001F062E9D|nr:sugar diacid recognition domain-containing protein [Agrococcus sp. ARC_14]MCH1883323.1 helix-turn-helix domain-containing protein [Agrococcus sp. ARC_14]
MPTYLSAALAQRIVEQLESTLETNLNLMDAAGLIIASGDASRVGQHHPGAREAAERGAPVEVRAETARPGERPGVNLPLLHRGRIIGVVGVTGDPVTVRPIAAVLVLTIALLLDRELELGQEARRDAQDRELLARLVFGTTPRLALASLQRRRADIPAPWVLHAVLSTTQQDAAFDPRTVAQLRVRAGEAPAIVAVLRGTMWILRSAAAGAAAPRRVRVSPLLLEQLGTEVRVVSSLRCESAEALRLEAAQLALLAARPELLPDASAPLDTASLGVEAAAAMLPADTAEAFRRHLAGLRVVDLDTLRHFLDTGSVAAAALRGYTHRNTVMQRLARVTRISGLDPRAAGDAATLRLALVLQRAVRPIEPEPSPASEPELGGEPGVQHAHLATVDPSET